MCVELIVSVVVGNYIACLAVYMRPDGMGWDGTHTLSYLASPFFFLDYYYCFTFLPIRVYFVFAFLFFHFVVVIVVVGIFIIVLLVLIFHVT